MRQSTSCILCKKNCENNQKVSCSSCKQRVHLKCANVGLNFGNRNFICRLCHQKSASKSTPSILSPLDPSNSNLLESISGNRNDSSSNYLSYGKLNSKLNSKTVHDLFVLHLNIGSLVLNIDQIKSLISQTKVRPDVICITESRLMDKKLTGGSI